MKRFSVLFIGFLMVFFTIQPAKAAVLPWEPVVDATHGGGSGFGNPNNAFPTSMVTFGDYMYVANLNTTVTEIWRTNNGTDWKPVVGFGAEAESFTMLAVFNNQLYAFNSNTTVGDEHVDIYRTSNGTAWATLTPISDVVIPLTNPVVYDGALYISVYDNNLGALAVYESTNGSDWTLVVTGIPTGLGKNTIIKSMATFDNDLYVGTSNPTGTEVWRYDGSNWTKDNENGFDDAENSGTGTLTVFGNYLYATTDNDKGSEVWRTPGDQTWERVTNSGFNQNTEVTITTGNAVFENNFYIGASNSTEANSAKVFRSSDGVIWDQVNINGFGQPDNGMVILAVLGDYLYAGTGTNPFLGGGETTEIYRYSTPAEPVLPQTGADSLNNYILDAIM